MRNHKLLFLITLGYFMLGLVNIHLALAGLLCMGLPFVLLFRTRRKTWCQGLCPRASLFSFWGSVRPGEGRRVPGIFRGPDLRFVVLGYFGLNLLFVLLSTVAVGTGRIASMEYIRLLMVFAFPGPLPSLLPWSPGIPWLTHLAYRVYSLMLTSTLVGLGLAWIWRSRTWCLICPVGNLSQRLSKQWK